MKRILIIDDEAPIRGMLRQLLEKSGFAVDDAPDGKQGLLRFEESPADLIITDLIMPEHEGIETIIGLRRLSPDVKIIAISGGGRIQPHDYLSIAVKVGASCAFEKPIEMKALVAKVQELLAD